MHLVLAAAHARRGELQEARSWFAKAGSPAAGAEPRGDTSAWLIEQAATQLTAERPDDQADAP